MLRSTIVTILILVAVPCGAGAGNDAACVALLEDEREQAANDNLEVELGQLRFAAFEKIYQLVDGLWKHEAIERMTWLKAKHDRDAAQGELERARLILARQQSLVEQLRLGCSASGATSREAREASRRYLQANCDQHAKAIDVAKINLAFNREWLASVRALREGSAGTATAQDVILAELDVELEEQRLADAEVRTDACRKGLAQGS